MSRPLLLLLDLEGVLSSGGEPIGEAIALVQEARRVCRVAVLTNASPAEVAALGLEPLVDAVITPERIGAAKPSAEAFRRALRVLQASPDTTTFCDDAVVNVAAAALLGIDAVHTPDTAALATALAVRGLDNGRSTEHRQWTADAGPTSDALIVSLPDRGDAEELAETLHIAGWEPCTVNSHRLAGDDDPEAVEWTVLVVTGPGGLPAGTHRGTLELEATPLGGFVHTPHPTG
jgi:hypothetical protein